MDTVRQIYEVGYNWSNVGETYAGFRHGVTGEQLDLSGVSPLFIQQCDFTSWGKENYFCQESYHDRHID